jgi:hypothetical protein
MSFTLVARLSATHQRAQTVSGPREREVLLTTDLERETTTQPLHGGVEGEKTACVRACVVQDGCISGAVHDPSPRDQGRGLQLAATAAPGARRVSPAGHALDRRLRGKGAQNALQFLFAQAEDELAIAILHVERVFLAQVHVAPLAQWHAEGPHDLRRDALGEQVVEGDAHGGELLSRAPQLPLGGIIMCL